MNLALTSQEGSLLKTQLDARLEELERDLVRTDKPDLQHALARDVEMLRKIEERLARVLSARAAARVRVVR
jgi:hypothetical protein